MMSEIRRHEQGTVVGIDRRTIDPVVIDTLTAESGTGSMAIATIGVIVVGTETGIEDRDPGTVSTVVTGTHRHVLHEMLSREEWSPGLDPGVRTQDEAVVVTIKSSMYLTPST